MVVSTASRPLVDGASRVASAAAVAVLGEASGTDRAPRASRAARRDEAGTSERGSGSEQLPGLLEGVSEPRRIASLEAAVPK